MYAIASPLVNALAYETLENSRKRYYTRNPFSEEEHVEWFSCLSDVKIPDDNDDDDTTMYSVSDQQDQDQQSQLQPEDTEIDAEVVVGSYEEGGEEEEDDMTTMNGVLSHAIPIHMANNVTNILSDEEFGIIASWLPNRYTLNSPKLLFSGLKDGFSLSHMYSKCAGYEPLVFIIQTCTTGNVFGVFVPVAVNLFQRQYMGTGEAFLFRIAPGPPRKYEWSEQYSKNTHFMHMEKGSFSVGGGGAGAGLWFDDELYHGESSVCDTFNNEPLNVGSKEFKIKNFEVVTFVGSYDDYDDFY